MLQSELKPLKLSLKWYGERNLMKDLITFIPFVGERAAKLVISQQGTLLLLLFLAVILIAAQRLGISEKLGLPNVDALIFPGQSK